MAESLLDELLMSSVTMCVRLWFAHSSGGRVVIVIADNFNIHTAQGARLVRTMLTELFGQVYLVYTPAYDPDTNRVEWLWRVSRHVMS
jgi:transposase